MRTGWGVGVALLALGACARLPPPLPSPVPGVAARRTALPRTVGLIGPKRQHAPLFLGVPGTNFFVLRSWLDRWTGRAATQLYVSDSYRGPERVWDAARGPAGTVLPFAAIDREQIDCRGGCAWTEDFAAELTARELTAPDGLTVIFSARSGATMTIAVTPRQLRLQRAAIAAVRPEVPGPKFPG